MSDTDRSDELSEFNFELFEKRSRPIASLPEVTLQARGGMSMNGTAQKALGSPDAVELLFDRAKRVIAIRPSNLNTRNAYALNAVSSGGSTFVISSKGRTP